MTTTPTSGAADMLDLIEAYAEARHRQGHSSYNAQTAAALQAVKDALAAGQATEAQPGVVYAELPVPNYPKSGGFPGTFAEAQMRAFADATCALRASHGQAPASVLHLVHSAFAEIAMAFPKAFALHKVGIADTAVREALAAPATADSVQEDAARYRLLRRGRHWSVIDGIGNDLLRAEALDAAIDAARKQGASHDR